MNLNEKTPLLGNISATQFMKMFWQRKARCIRQAIPGYLGAVTPRDVLKLATRDDMETRLILREGKQWHVEHGPISKRALASLPKKNWTILVQGIDLVVPAARELRERFSFIPYARLDDVMVSLAAPGGGVGPHFDRYDVFLLQGQGRRRWQVSTQSDLSLRDDVPLKVLRRFVAEDDWVLHPGDMLYLPPRYAHDGVAVDQCLTFSIGFRSPTSSEIINAGLEAALDSEVETTSTERENLAASATPALLPESYIKRFHKTLNAMRWSIDDASQLAGVYASTPKAHVVFDANESACSPREIATALKRKGTTLKLACATLALYDAKNMYINGEVLPLDPALLPLFDDRTLESPLKFPTPTLSLLCDWLESGWIEKIH